MHGGAFAGQLTHAIAARNLLLEQLVLAQQRGPLASAVRGRQHNVRLKGFRQKVKSPLAHGFDRKFHGRHRGEHDHRDRRIALARGRQNVEPGAVGHLLVRDYDIKIFIGKQLCAAQNTFRFPHGMAVALQMTGKDPPHVGFVINDQDASHGFGYRFRELAAALGRSREKQTPSGPLRVKLNSPRCACAMLRTIESPRPVPLGFVVKNGSNRC